jgi:hypothetical protein
VNKVALGQAVSEYFGFPCEFSFDSLHHLGLEEWVHQWPLYQVYTVPPHHTSIQPLNTGRFLPLVTHPSHCSVSSNGEVIFRVACSTDRNIYRFLGYVLLLIADVGHAAYRWLQSIRSWLPAIHASLITCLRDVYHP